MLGMMEEASKLLLDYLHLHSQENTIVSEPFLHSEKVSLLVFLNKHMLMVCSNNNH